MAPHLKAAMIATLAAACGQATGVDDAGRINATVPARMSGYLVFEQTTMTSPTSSR